MKHIDSNLPATIEHFHSLVPLDTNNQKSAAAFGYNSWLYKAVSSNDGCTYALRRLEGTWCTRLCVLKANVVCLGFRLTSEKSVHSLQSWKRINNANVVTIHDCFTTRAFGDSSLVFVTDYHPLSKTIAEQHLQHVLGHSRARPPSGFIPEQTLWGYVVQIASALKAIHSSGLAARIISYSKIILTNKNRIRLNACGILDVVQTDEHHPLQAVQHEDLIQLGRLLLILASNNPNAVLSPKYLANLSRQYTARFQDCVNSLLNQPLDIHTFLTSIADQVFTIFDSTLHLEDVLTSDLNRELENARLVRLLTKLGFVNERPEYNEPQQQTHTRHTGQWSETGERYPLKLFRDYVFHQVNAEGRAVIDLGHVLSCLNKLDAGSEEKIALVTRDEQNVLVVSYKEIKRALEGAFQDLMKMGWR